MFKPKMDQTYYMINSRFQIRETTRTSSQKSADRIAAGNCFKSKAEAEAFQSHVLSLAKHGYYKVQPVYGFFSKLLTLLAYILLGLIILAACCLVIDFIFWIFDINVNLFGIKI